jgi:hypothetical protein
MTPRTNGKVWERQVANDLGGVRTGPTGLNDPDIKDLPIPFAVECKYRQRLSIQNADLKQAHLNARGLPWGVFIREARSGRRFVVLPYSVFLDFWKAKVDTVNE